MSARQTTTPLSTNGIEMTTQVSRTDQAPARCRWGLNGIESWVTKQSARASANASEKRQRLAPRAASLKRRGRRWTSRAPAVNPNSATEIATKAKWYHIVALKIRVSATSYISVERVTKNRPA